MSISTLQSGHQLIDQLLLKRDYSPLFFCLFLQFLKLICVMILKTILLWLDLA